MPQGKSSTARAASASAEKPVEQTAHGGEARAEEGLVMEMAAERRSLKEDLQQQKDVSTNILKELRQLSLRMENFEAGQGVVMQDISRVNERISALEKSADEPIRQEVKETTKEMTEKSRSFLVRLWDGTKRELKPAKPNHDHVKGLVVGNAIEFLTLLLAAQLAPVAVMNGISTLLFI